MRLDLVRRSECRQASRKRVGAANCGRQAAVFMPRRHRRVRATGELTTDCPVENMSDTMFDSEQTFLKSFDRKSRRETSSRAEKERLWQRKWNRRPDRISRGRAHVVRTRKHNLRLIQVSSSKRTGKMSSHLTKSSAASSSQRFGGKYMAPRLPDFSDGSL